MLESRDTYFWSAHSGAEIDLFVIHRGRRLGFEIELADAPRVSRSMRAALEDLRLDHLYVVVPGRLTYGAEERITVLGLEGIESELQGTGAYRPSSLAAAQSASGTLAPFGELSRELPSPPSAAPATGAPASRKTEPAGRTRG